MAVATAIAGAAVAAGVAGSVISAKSQQKAAKKAQAANLANARNQQELEKAIFMQSRGSEGFATLPFFAIRDPNNLPPEAEGAIEPELFQYALANWDALTQMEPAARYEQLQNASKSFGSMSQDAISTVQDIFDKSLATEELGNIEGLKDARLDRAEVIRNVGKEQLEEQLNRINAQQRARGFSGDSLSSNRMQFDAARKIATDAALAESDAKVANAQDEANILNNDVARRVGSVGLPGQVADSALDMANAPNRALVREQQTAMSLFSPFSIGTGSYNPTPLPKVEPIAGTGAIIGTGLSALGSGVGSLAGAGAFGKIGGSTTGAATSSSSASHRAFADPGGEL